MADIQISLGSIRGRCVGQSIQYRTNMQTKATLSNVSEQLPIR